jgi:hypothetical protein
MCGQGKLNEPELLLFFYTSLTGFKRGRVTTRALLSNHFAKTL